MRCFKFAAAKMLSTDKLTKKYCLTWKRYFAKKKTFPIGHHYQSLSAFEIIKNVKDNKKEYFGEQEFNVKFKDGTEKKIFYQKCEHINFHQGFNDMNLDLFILPYLINSMKVNFEFYPQSVFSLIINKNTLNFF